METIARRSAQLALVLLAALVALAAARVAGAQSQLSIDAVPGARCAWDGALGEDVCALPIGPGVEIDAPRSAWLPQPDGFDVSWGDEQLSLRFCPGSLEAATFCLDTLRGTERSELPRIPFLDAFVSPEPPLTTIGLDLGANLVADELGLSSDLSAMLVPGEKYFVYHTLSAGLTAQVPGLDFVKLSSGGDPTTFVAGAEHPFFYFEGEFALPFGQAAGEDPEPRSEQDPQEEEDAPVVAMALDSEGGIPFVPLRTRGVEPYIEEFFGHLYVRGPVPIHPLAELDGTLVVDLDPDEDRDHPFEAAYYTSPDVELGGNGALSVALPFSFLDLSALGLELGEATAQLKTSEAEDRLVFSGIVTSESFLAGLPIPIPIRPDARVEAWGRVSWQSPLGSYAHLEGEMGVSLAGLGQLTGLPLGEIQATDAVLDLNATGVTLQGSTMSQIHPMIASGALALTVHVATHGDGGFVEFRGDVVIGNEAIRDATIRIDAVGMTVNGTWIVDDTTFAMIGAFSASGYRLAGSAPVADPIAFNAQTRATAELALAAQQAILADLQADLAALRADLDAAQSDLAAARAAVDAAQGEVSRLQSLINSAAKSRDGAYASYRWWVKKYCAWYDAVCQAKRAANISYHWGRYTYYAGLVTTYSAAKAVALGVLQAAEDVLAAIQAIVAALEAQVALVASQVEAAANAAALVQAQLDALPDVSGTIEAMVTVILEDGVASGRVDATWNGVALGGGTVRLASPAEACVEIPGEGTLCTPL